MALSKTERAHLEGFVWKVTPKDYRSTSGGKRSILTLEHGATVLKPLSSFSDDELASKLGFQRWEGKKP